MFKGAFSSQSTIFLRGRQSFFLGVLRNLFYIKLLGRSIISTKGNAKMIYDAFKQLYQNINENNKK